MLSRLRRRFDRHLHRRSMRRLLLEPLEARHLLATVSVSLSEHAVEGITDGSFSIGRSGDEDVWPDTLTIHYRVEGGGENPAEEDDHDHPETGMIELDVDTPYSYGSFHAHDDGIVEGTETVVITITSFSSSDPQAEYTIDTGSANVDINEDLTSMPVASITATDASAAEQGSNPGEFTISVSSSEPLNEPLTVNYSISGTAANGSDYQTIGTSVVIPAYDPEDPDNSQATVTIVPIDDAIYDPDETVILTLAGGAGYIVEGGSATVTIADNEPAPPPPLPSLVVSDASVTEGGLLVFTVTAEGTLTQNVTVNYTTANGSAVAPDDYTAASGQLAFSSSQTTQQVTVQTSDDAIHEVTETLYLNLSNAINATIGDGQGLGSITDNDSQPTLSVGDAEVTEGGILFFTVTISGASSQTVSVHYATSDGTAIESEDYAAASGSIFFSPGQTAPQTVAVSTVDDSIYEDDEYMFLDLSGASNAAIQNGTGVGTILDNELPPNVTYVEGLTTDTVCSCGCSCTFVTAKPDKQKGTAKVAAGDLRNVDGAGATAVVGGDIAFAPGFENATSIEATLTFDGVAGQTMYYDPSGLVPGASYRLAQQVNTAGLASGSYAWEMELVAHLPGGGTQTQLVRGDQPVDNRADSVFGGGWTPIDLDRLRPTPFNGFQWQKGDGSSFIFKYQSGAWVRPKGEPDFSSFTAENSTTYAIRKKDGETLRFNLEGILQSRTDRAGNVTAYSYADMDLDGQVDDVTSIVEAGGHSRSFGYQNGRVVTIADQDGLVTALGYDPQARLTSVTEPDPDGAGPLPASISYFSYDTIGNITSYTDAENNTTTFTYTNGIISAIVHPDGAQELLTVEIAAGLLFPGSGGPGSLWNPAILKPTAEIEAIYTTEVGDQWKFGFNRFGQQRWVIDPLGNVTQYEYNHNGENLVTKETGPDPLGPESSPVTRYEYDAKGNVTKTTLPDASIREATYNQSFSQPTSTTDERGNLIDYAYDSQGNLTALFQYLQLPANYQLTQFTYTTTGLLGQVQTMTDPLGRVTNYQYDAGGNLTQVTSAQGTSDQAIQQFGYDTFDNLVWFDDGLDRRTDFVVDRLGRTTQMTLPDPDGAGPLARPVYLYEHNKNNYLTHETDPLGRVTQYTYNNRNDVVEIKQPDHDNDGQLTVTTFAYDPRRRLISTTDPLGRVTTLGYDALDRNTTLTQPDPGGGSPVASTAYDVLGRISSVTDPLGNVTSYSYAGYWRQLTATLPDPDGSGPLAAPVYTSTFDAAGNRTGSTDPLGRATSHAYDALHRPTTVTQPDPDGGGPLAAPITSYQYDKASNLRFLTDPLGNATEYVYDSRSRLKQLIAADPDGAGPLAAPVTSFTYDDADQLLTQTDPLGRVTSFVYDALGRQTKVILPTSDGPDPVTQYAYDAAGRLTGITEGDDVVQPDPALPGPTVAAATVDDGGPGFSGGSGFVVFSTGYEGDHRGTPKEGGSVPLRTATWTFASLPPGRYQVATTWYTHSERATNAPFTLKDGSTTILSPAINQQLAPDDFAWDGMNWHSFGTYEFASGTITLTLTNAADGYVVADAVRIIRVGDILPAQTVDNDTANFATVGTWSSGSGGFGNGTHRQATAGTGAKKATATFNVTPGQYRVAAHWPASATLATNAPFTVRNGATILNSVAINQQVAPNDVWSSGVQWELLGETITILENATLTVELTDAANGPVRADAVQLLRVGETPTLPGADIQVIDNGNAGFTSTGSWTDLYHGYGDDFQNAPAGSGGQDATWTASVTPGTYRVSASWLAWQTFATNAPFTVLDAGTPLGTVTVNQQLVPEGFVHLAHGWQVLGTFTITGNSLTVKLTDDANGLVVADAIHIQRLSSPSLTRTTELAYDPLDNLNTVLEPDPDGAGPLLPPVTTFAYDAAGQLLETTDPMSRLTSYAYDSLGRTTQVTQPDPDGAGSLPRPFSTYTYDAASNLKTVTDALSRVTSFDHDNLYRRTKITDPLAGQTSFAYDAAGQLLSLTDPVGNATSWQYDLLGRTIAETNELNKTRTFAYDAASNLIERVDRLGRKTEYVYDNLYRNTSEKWYDGTTLVRTLSFNYDAANQLSSASDPAATYSYSYDALGRVTSEGQTLTGLTPGLNFARGYDVFSNQTSLSATIGGTADFTNSYQYDGLHRLTRVEQLGQAGGNAVEEKRVDFAYNAVGQFTAIARQHQPASAWEEVATTSFGYDGLGRLTDLDHLRGAANIANYGWTFDAKGRITQATSPDGTTDYSYDDTDQLTAADHNYQTDETYTYDENGNRTTTGYTTGTNNRLTSDGTFNYTYDDEGNRLTRTKISDSSLTEYSWDHRNRLTQVVERIGGTGTAITKQSDYTYDVFDRRLSKSVDSDGAGLGAAVATRFAYDGAHIALQFEGASTLTHRYLHGPVIDQILADEAIGGETLWPLTDNLGTVRDLIDSDGNALNHIEYDSFGQVTAETNAAIDHLFAFTGRERDEETGLYHYRARGYDPATGQFTGEDPKGIAAGDPNFVRYVGNSPTNYTDPSGLQKIFPEGRVPVTSPNPVGVFPDGSVRTIDQNIDPSVLEQMNRSGTAPRSVHRPGSPFGAPTNSRAGMGQSIDRPWTLPQNHALATGDLIYSYQSVEICGSDATPDMVYEWLKNFTHFNKGNIASVSIVRPGAFEPSVFQGKQYALFRPTPFGELPGKAGALNSLQYLVNPTAVAVELIPDNSTRTVTAVTLGNHMIVGIRKWSVHEKRDACGTKLIIETEAWEQRNGKINDQAMKAGGKEAMGGIWQNYLSNMARAATIDGGSTGRVKEYWLTRSSGGQNPFRFGLSGGGVAGPAVPPGYYGRGRAR